MKRRSRTALRDWVGFGVRWGGLALCALAIGPCIYSAWRGLVLDFPALPSQPYLRVSYFEGDVYVTLFRETGISWSWGNIWSLGSSTWSWNWSVPHIASNVDVGGVSIAILLLVMPAWIPPALLVPPTALLWFRHHYLRRAKPGHCPCGYNLAGLPAAATVCPECGRAIGAKGGVA